MSRMAELPLADRAALFGVVDACCGASGQFGDRLLEALASHLNYRDTTYFSGINLDDALQNRNVVVRGRACRMLPEYLERYAKIDIFRSPIALQRLANPGVTAMHLLPSALCDQHRPYVENFIRRAGARTIFAMHIEGGTGSAFLGVLDFGDPMDGTDLVRLSLLRRVLSAELERENCRLARTEAASLTRRELAVAELVARGLSNAEIARQLDLQIDTVKKYLTRVYQVLGVRSRTQLALRLR